MPPLRLEDELPTSGINFQGLEERLDSTALAAVIQHHTTIEGRQAFRHSGLWPVLLEGMGRRTSLEFQAYVNDYVGVGQATSGQRRDYADNQRRIRLQPAAELDAKRKMKRLEELEQAKKNYWEELEQAEKRTEQARKEAADNRWIVYDDSALGASYSLSGSQGTSTVLGKHTLDEGQQSKAKKSRSSSPAIKKEPDERNTGLRAIDTTSKFPEIDNRYGVTFKEAFDAARPNRSVQIRNVYAGFQSMLRLMEKFHIDTILPQLFRGVMQMAEGSMNAPQAEKDYRSQTTPVDDISGRFQSDRDQFLDRIKAYSSAVSLARRIKEKTDLGDDLLKRLGCNRSRGISYATHMYEVLCFSDINGNLAAWPSYKSSQRFDRDKRTWEKRRRVGEMLLTDLGNEVGLGWLFLFPEDLKVLGLQEISTYEMRMLCFLLKRADFYEPLAAIAGILSPLIEKLSRAPPAETSLNDCRGGLPAILRGMKNAVHHNSFQSANYDIENTPFDQQIIKMLCEMPWDNEEILQVGLSFCRSRAVGCSKNDITRLCGNEWLNDNIILLAIDLVLRLVKTEQKDLNVRVIDPLVTKDAILKETKLQATNEGLTFLPLNYGEHWVLAVIDDLERVIRICASEHIPKRSAPLPDQLKKLCHLGKKEAMKDIQGYGVKIEKVWKQSDTNNCGVAVIANALAAAQKTPYPDTIDVQELRLFGALMMGKAMWTAYLVKKTYELGGNDLVEQLNDLEEHLD